MTVVRSLTLTGVDEFQSIPFCLWIDLFVVRIDTIFLKPRGPGLARVGAQFVLLTEGRYSAHATFFFFPV